MNRNREIFILHLSFGLNSFSIADAINNNFLIQNQHNVESEIIISFLLFIFKFII